MTQPNNPITLIHETYTNHQRLTNEIIRIAYFYLVLCIWDCLFTSRKSEKSVLKYRFWIDPFDGLFGQQTTAEKKFKESGLGLYFLFCYCLYLTNSLYMT